jgi:hypothetical protein
VNPWCAEGLTAEPLTNGYYSIVTGITIIDGQMTEFTNAADKEVDYIRYERTLASGIWNPLYLPFEVPMSELIDDFDVAYINDVHHRIDEANNEVTGMYAEYVKITNPNATLKANYPYMIRPKSATKLELVFEDVILHKAEEKSIVCSSVFTEFKVTGTYHRMYRTDLGDRLVVTANGWEKLKETSVLNPFRLYMTITPLNDSPYTISDEVLSNVKAFVRGEEGTTDIEGVEFITNGEELIFDLQGRRVLEPKKGSIYIINGKKVYYNK